MNPSLTRREVLALAPGLLAVPALVDPRRLAHVAAAPAAGTSLTAAIDAALAAAVKDVFPGVALAVIQAGETIYTGAAGVASVEQQTPLTFGDRQRIYSITKAFTATVVHQLVDEGAISLDDTATKWLDDPAVTAVPNADQATLRQLLNHTSGIYDFADDNDSSFWVDAFLGPEADWTKVWTPQELLAYADGAKHGPYFAPGEGCFYSNTNYILAGLIVEKVTGNTFGTELQNRILTPLGLADTFFPEGAEMPEGTVDAYQVVEGELLNVAVSNLSWAWTFGGMISTPADLARFSRAIYSGELLSPDSFAEMFTFVPAEKPGKFEGEGVYKIGSPNGELVGADGTGPGANSALMRLEAADLTVILFQNAAGDGVDPDPLRDEVIRLVLASA